MTGAAPAQETDLEQRALALVNEARAEAGLDALSYSASLAEAAQQHAEDMLERDYYAHETPGGETFADRIREAGDERWLLTAEN
ncbi:MAG TPA: CAP domain-containing protein, partial [Aurantimonas sp.]|nr:CAP domain-containing protein [Aurantimonas sp.]